MANFLNVPAGRFAVSADDDAARRKREEIARKLREGQDVNVTNTGVIVTSDDPQATNETLVVPPGKLAASFYWYERKPELLEHERAAMHQFFPAFQMDRLGDGRLYWIGNLNPRGKHGGVWTIQAVYDHNHPHNDSYGGSVKVYSIKPALEDLAREVGGLPHVLSDGGGNLYMCTARMEDVTSGKKKVTSAATSLGWAVKWIWMVEGWLCGEVKESVVFDHGRV
ncbi:MAG: hypothetical protein FWB78_09065 [Treponema sp.]|nr:hypothetical protein [Treponema sp.]